jgi:hypothetical protein
MRGSLWIAVDEQGRGAVGFTEEGVLNALLGSNQVSVGRLSAWALCGAMVQASVLPVRFTHRWSSRTALQERQSW